MDLIKEAGLNTLLGMGMTFLVLILLSLIIALFGKILNGGFTVKKATGESEAVDASRTPEVTKVPSKDAGTPQEECPAGSRAPADTTDTPEGDGSLMAVIASAVAAYEGDVTPEIVALISVAVMAYQAEAGSSLKPGMGGFAARKIRKSRRHFA